jgi:hypothetical protein
LREESKGTQVTGQAPRVEGLQKIGIATLQGSPSDIVLIVAGRGYDDFDPVRWRDVSQFFNGPDGLDRLVAVPVRHHNIHRRVAAIDGVTFSVP